MMSILQIIQFTQIEFGSQYFYYSSSRIHVSFVILYSYSIFNLNYIFESNITSAFSPMNRESQYQALKNLVNKINSEIHEIKYRAINNLHNKIIHHLIDTSLFINFKELPGTLLNWINDQCELSDQDVTVSTLEYLLKILIILSTYLQYEDGLLLLRKYESLEFFEGFKKYFDQNWAYKGSRILVKDITDAINQLINKLLIIGHSQHKQETLSTNNPQKKQASSKQQSKKQKEPQIIKSDTLTLKFRSLLIKMPETVEKRIFEALVEIKYNKKSQKYHYLQNLLILCRSYRQYYLRNKPQIFQLLNQLLHEQKFYKSENGSLNILCTEIVCQIMVVLLDGLVWNHEQAYKFEHEMTHYNQVVCMSQIQFKKINCIEVQIPITKYISKVIEGGIVLSKIIDNIKKHSQIISAQDLIDLQYQFSPLFYIQLLFTFPEQKLMACHQSISATIDSYSKHFPNSINNFLQILPENISKQIPCLVSYQKQAQQQVSSHQLQKLLPQNGFEVSENLHQISAIIDNLNNGISGLIISPQKFIKVYVDIWLTLACSVARQDPLMAYYPAIKSIILNVTASKYEEVSISFYEELYYNLKNEENYLVYLNSTEKRHKIIQMIFCEEVLTNQILRNSLDSQRTLQLMLEIVRQMCHRKRQSIFLNYLTIIYSLCYHPSERIRQVSQHILKLIPKKYQIPIILMKLFSKDQQVRCKILAELCQASQQEMNIHDLILKIAEGHFQNNKKQLKISQQSLVNYINIILNEDLQTQIRISGATELADYLERLNLINAPTNQLEQFSAILHEKIFECIKNKEDPLLTERYILLYSILCIKLQMLQKNLDPEFLASLLGLVKTDRIRASLILLIYYKIFQTPFSSNILMNWTIKYYPHICLAILQIETPVRIYEKYEPKLKQAIIANREEKVDTFSDFYQLSCSQLLNKQKRPNLKLFEKYLVSAISHNNAYEISKLNFLIFFDQLISSSPYQLPANNISSFVINHLINLQSLQNKKELQIRNMQMDLVSLIDRLGFKRIKNIEKYLEEISGSPKIKAKLTLWQGIITKANKSQETKSNDEFIEKILKMCDADIPNDILQQIYRILLLKKQIQWQKYGDYPNLRLIQSLIKTLKDVPSNNDSHIFLRLTAFLVLKKYLKENEGANQHRASIIGLFTLILFEKSELFVGQLIQTIDCICLMCENFTEVQFPFYNKVVTKMVKMFKVVPLVKSDKSQDQPSIMLICSILRLLNSGLKSYFMLQQAYPQPPKAIYSLLKTLESNICIDTAVLFLNPVVLLSFISNPNNNRDRIFYMLSTINQYLYLECMRNYDNIEYLMKTTNLLSNSLEVIILFTQDQQRVEGNCSDHEFEAFHFIGCLLEKLATNPDIFLYRLTRLLQSPEDSQNGDKLPEISQILPLLSKPINRLSTYSLLKHKQKYSNGYLRMFGWIALIWQNSEELYRKYPLEIDQNMLHIIDCYIQMKEIRQTYRLAIRNLKAQQHILGKQQLNQQIKQELKCLQMIYATNIDSKKSRKKANKSRLDIEGNDPYALFGELDKSEDFCIFLLSIYTPRLPTAYEEDEEDEADYQLNYYHEQNISLSLKYIQKLFRVLEEIKRANVYDENNQLENKKQGLQQLLHKLIINYFNNPLTAQIASNYIMEKNSELVDSLIKRILNLGAIEQTHAQEAGHYKQYLVLLGELCCCESVRSMIFKQKVIEELNSKIIKMEENKIAKFNYSLLYHICIFYGYISVYKDGNAKILNDKRILDFFCKILASQKSQVIDEKIFDVLMNLTSFKHHKSLFMANKEIHKICLGLLTNNKLSFKHKVLSVIYNILYKNAAGIKMYRKRQVLELLEEITNEEQRDSAEQKQTQILANTLIEILEKEIE